ncbi:hypothetical protein [Deinococcus sp.]|uniref:hypothetical protein n=1 Tax=Deinococcus sp. TaxID=47478 RepID=UPI003CC52B2D
MLKEISTASLDDIQGGLFVDASGCIGYGTLFSYPTGSVSLNLPTCGTPTPVCSTPAPAPSCGSSLTTIAVQYFVANYCAPVTTCKPAPTPAPKPTGCTPAPKPTCGGTTPAPSTPF